MINCREQLYRDLNEFLEEDNQEEGVIAYSLMAITLDKTQNFHLTSACGGSMIATVDGLNLVIDDITKEKESE